MIKVENKIKAGKAKEKDNGVVMFKEPMQIVGCHERQWNNTIYDLATLDITKYNGTITADHEAKLSNVIGKVINLRKSKNGVTIDGIRYAVKENPLAVLAKNLLLGGFSNGFSCETIGPDPDEDLVWKNHGLSGLSQVVYPNASECHATIENSIKECKKLGFAKNDVEDAVKFIKNFDAEDKAEIEQETNIEMIEAELLDIKAEYAELQEKEKALKERAKELRSKL